MNRATRGPTRPGWLCLALLLAGCAEEEEPATDGVSGASADGGGRGSTVDAPATTTGGAGTGGELGTTGGAPPGGAGSGGAFFDLGGAGANTGGTVTFTGGANTGGVITPTGGAGTGGVVTPTGGVVTPTGGANTGGVVTPTGGANTGGVVTPTGGANTGGVVTPTGGAGTGGEEGPTGGTATEPRGMTLYYVRHAETVANALDDHNPSAEDADTLTELGQRQVSDLTTYLVENGVTPDAVLVSPALRSQHTIEPYLVSTGLVGVVWPELWECCGSDPTGAPLPTEPARYDFFTVSVEAQNMALREGDPGTFWQIDTYEQGLYMVMQARDLLLTGYGQSGKTVVISGHAISGTILIGLLRGLDLTGGIEQTGPNAIYMLNTGVQLLTQDPATGLFELEGSNVNRPATE